MCYLGQADFNLDDLVSKCKNDQLMIQLMTTQKGLKNNVEKTLGTLSVRFDTTTKSSLLQARIQGEKISDLRFCASNMNILQIYKPKSVAQVVIVCGERSSRFDYVDCFIPEKNCVLVMRTEAVNYNPMVIWRNFDINSIRLCYSNPNIPINFGVKDYAMISGTHMLVGGVILTITEMANEHLKIRSLISLYER
jgi:hypothetical protein